MWTGACSAVPAGGHVTYAPDEPELRDGLMASTAGGTAWRCLRCGAFVTGPA